MKDKYEEAEIELIKFKACDILTVSGEAGNSEDSEEDNW